MNAGELIQWAEDNYVKEQTIDGFYFAFENYRIDNPDEFSAYFKDFEQRKLHLDVNKLSLLIHNWRTDPTYCVVSELSIYYNEGYSGVYGMMFELSGEACDDYFDW